MSDSKGGSIYSVHPAVAYTQAIIRNLPTKTGRSLDEWARLVLQSGLSDARQQREWLKKEYKIGGTTARLITDRASGKWTEESDEAAYLRAAENYVDAMYSGKKAGFRPLHDKLIEIGISLGDDVKICPGKTIVPLYRKHVFAEIKPAALTRVDLGLALKKVKQPLSDRLIDTGGLAKGDRITHRFALTSLGEIDDEVATWLRIAYDLDA